LEHDACVETPLEAARGHFLNAGFTLASRVCTGLATLPPAYWAVTYQIAIELLQKRFLHSCRRVPYQGHSQPRVASSALGVETNGALQ